MRENEDENIGGELWLLTSLPIMKTVSPLKGCVTTLWEFLVISTPTKIKLKVRAQWKH